jgi:ribosomal protein L37E
MQCIADYTDTPDSRARLVRYTFGDLERERIDECEQCNQQSFVVQVKFCANHRKVRRSSSNHSQNEKLQLYGFPSVEEFTKKMKRRQRQKLAILTHSQLCQLSFKIVFAEDPIVSIIYSDDVTPGTVQTLTEMGYNCEVGPSNKLTITPGHPTVV